jgi:hypothetical protein
MSRSSRSFGIIDGELIRNSMDPINANAINLRIWSVIPFDIRLLPTFN